MDEISEVIRNTLIDISELKIPLKKVSSESEPLFINLGNNLQGIFSDAESLTALTRETAMLVDGESGSNILGNIGDFSRESLGRLEACREDVSSVLPQVEKCSDNLKRLHDMCPVIKTIAKKLNIVALHISMESSRSRECEEMFNFFVQEIKQLANMVNEISAKIREDSVKAKTSQIADFTSLSERKETLSSLADNAHSSVEDNLHQIEELISMALKTMRRSENHSNKISGLVGEVVVAIQFHDIARQQIEHILETLEEIGTFFNETSDDEPGRNDERINNLAKTYAILSVQVEQINQVIREIKNAYKKIKRSFHEIGNEVEVLVEGMADLNINTDALEHRGNTFEILISGLNQLENIMSQGKEMAMMIDSNLKQSAETAKNLAGHLTQMEDISMDLHIKAINALIMSKRLGSEGKTLSVLAEDVTEVSLDSNSFVADVVDILKTIGDMATNLSCLSHDEYYLGGENAQQVDLSRGIDMISNVYNEFLNKSARSVQQSKQLKREISRLESELEFLLEMETTLSGQQEIINKLMKKITPFIPEDIIADNSLDHLSDRYTMESERGAHNRALKKDSSDSSYFEDFGKDLMEDNDSGEEGSLGDNIELF